MTRITPNTMFATPDNAEALNDWIGRLPASDGVRTAAIIAAEMAWNLAAKITNEHNESSDNA